MSRCPGFEADATGVRVEQMSHAMPVRDEPAITSGYVWAENLRQAVDRYRGPAMLVCTLAERALDDCVAGAIGAAAATVTEVGPLFGKLSDGQLAERLEAALWLGWSELLMDRPGAALARLDRAIRVGQLLGAPADILFHLQAGRFLALRASGDLHGAVEAARNAAALAVERTDLRAYAIALTRGISVWADGVYGHAVHRAEPLALRTAPATDWYPLMFQQLLAEAWLDGGDAVTCLSYVTALGGPELPMVCVPSRVTWYEMLTRAALRAERLELAEEYAARAHAQAEVLGLCGRDGLALLAKAQVLACRPTDHRDAAATALAAADALHQADLRFDAARARALAGTVLAYCGAVDEADAQLRAASEAMTDSGARCAVPQVTSPRPRVRQAGHASLTGREGEVAALVCEGFTNRQISTRLHISEKTVERHLSRVFAKLGVANRVGVVQRLQSGTGAGP
jgi:DNA-binding CsgD family transcriptional regulator